MGRVQLYNEEIKDLLTSDNAAIRIHEDKEGGIYLKGASKRVVSSAHEVSTLPPTSMVQP